MNFFDLLFITLLGVCVAQSYRRPLRFSFFLGLLLIGLAWLAQYLAADLNRVLARYLHLHQPALGYGLLYLFGIWPAWVVGRFLAPLLDFLGRGKLRLFSAIANGTLISVGGMLPIALAVKKGIPTFADDLRVSWIYLPLKRLLQILA